MYTLQSIYTGKYISSLFSDEHKQTFQANTINDAYTWENRDTALKIAIEIGRCRIINVCQHLEKK